MYSIKILIKLKFLNIKKLTKKKKYKRHNEISISISVFMQDILTNKIQIIKKCLKHAQKTFKNV